MRAKNTPGVRNSKPKPISIILPLCCLRDEADRIDVYRSDIEYKSGYDKDEWIRDDTSEDDKWTKVVEKNCNYKFFVKPILKTSQHLMLVNIDPPLLQMDIQKLLLYKISNLFFLIKISTNFILNIT